MNRYEKLLFAILILTLVVSFTSCRDKKERNRAQHQVEKVKEDINDAADKVSDKVQDGADAVKDAWNDAKKDVKQGAEKAKKEIKEGYNDLKKKQVRSLIDFEYVFSVSCNILHINRLWLDL